MLHTLITRCVCTPRTLNITQALPYKQYLEQVRPHIRQAAESIYSRSQLIAIAVIDVIIAITSRYISSSDSENATMLSEIVTSAIHGCFMPHDDITGNFASYTSRRIQQSDSIVGTTMAESGEQVGTLEGARMIFSGAIGQPAEQMLRRSLKVQSRRLLISSMTTQ